MLSGEIVLTPLRHTPAPAGARIRKDVLVAMSDGVEVSLDVYCPAENGHFAALYAVSPYRKDLTHLPPSASFRFRECGDIDWWLNRGYAFIHADIRGTGHSRQGQWRNGALREQRDMVETIGWIAAQPWSNGRVGMTGESYYGAVQWLAAQHQPPALRAIAPYDAFADPYRDACYHGGLPCAGFLSWWAYNTRALTLLDEPGPHAPHIMAFDPVGEALRNPVDGPMWQERSAELSRIRTPTYSIGNWNMVGLHLRGNLTGYEQAQAPKKLMVYGGEGHHASIDFFNSLELHNELDRWFGHWLKDERTGVMEEPPVTLYIRNGGGFRAEGEWPPRRARIRKLFLRQGRQRGAESLNRGALSWEPPTDDKPSVYDYPQEKWGGWPGFGTTVFEGLAPNPTKAILTFTSKPLTRDLEILGPIVLRLYAESDQNDMDFIVKLSDEHARPLFAPRFLPTRAQWVTRGFLRASHAATKDEEKSRPGRPYYRHDAPRLI